MFIYTYNQFVLSESLIIAKVIKSFVVLAKEKQKLLPNQIKQLSIHTGMQVTFLVIFNFKTFLQ